MSKPLHHKVKALAAMADRMAKMIDDRGGSRTAGQMQAEVNRLKAGAEALDKVRANRSPLDTPEAHALKVAKLAQKFDREVTAAINRFGSIVHEGLQAVQKRIDEKIDLRPNAFAEEIRAAFRTLDRKAKLQLLGDLVRDNRGPELAAIIKAPPLLSGLPAADIASYEKAILSTHAGDEVAEQAWLGEMFETSITAANTAGDLARSFIDPSELARIERADALASEAGAAFDQSIQ